MLWVLMSLFPYSTYNLRFFCNKVVFNKQHGMEKVPRDQRERATSQAVSEATAETLNSAFFRSDNYSPQVL